MPLEMLFVEAARAAGAQAPDATLAAVAAELVARWSEPHRHYHNLDHLRACLDELHDPVTRLAVWGHDAVYDPRSPANEERSALLLAHLLHRCAVPSARIAEAARLVRLTKGHAVEPGDERGMAMADADLSVLTRAWPSYLSYVDAVRREYAHVSDDLWRAGRAAVLRGLLDLPAMFHLHPEREEPARTNINRELAQLHHDGGA
jgi:predicted metal-dependent HD superfamily phosphohydrolase